MSETSTLLKEAEDSMSSGEWDRAIEKLEELAKCEVKTPDVFSKLAQANAVRGRFLTVLSVYLEWADTAIESGNIEQAERALGYAQNLRPDSTDVHEMAVKIARKKLAPEALADQLIELAHLHLEKGDGDRSVALIREAVEARPEDDTLALQLGEVYISVGQIGSGLKIFQDFVEKHSDCGEPGKLLEPLRRINLLKADDIESTLHLGRVYLALDRVDQAEEQFRAVLRLDLENQNALLELARVCQKKGLFRNGLLALNRVVQLNPELPIARRLMGELHLAASSPQEAVKEFLEAARLYSEADEIDNMIEVYRTVLRFDENAEALSRLRSLSFTENYNEDLTANLFPPVEEECDETEEISQDQTSLEPDEQATRPGPVAPATAEQDDEFRELALIEKEKAEVTKVGLVRKRPALVKKSKFSQRGPDKPTLLRAGLRRREQSQLKPGLDRKSDIGGKREQKRKPVLPPKEMTAPAEAIETLRPVAEPMRPMETPFEDEPGNIDSIFGEPHSVLDQTEKEIPPYEDVFDSESQLEPDASGDSPPRPPTELLGEPSVEEVLEPQVEEGPIEPVEELNAQFSPPKAHIEVIEEQEKVGPLAEDSVEPEETQDSPHLHTQDVVDAEILFPSDDEELFAGFESMDSIFGFEDDFMAFDDPVQDAPLFPPVESEIGNEESEALSMEASEMELQVAFTEKEESDLSWLFETTDTETAEIPAAPEDYPEQPPEELAETSLEPPGEATPAVDTEAERFPNEEEFVPQPAFKSALREEDTNEPDFGWTFELEEATEPEASPLFPVEEVQAEISPLFPVEDPFIDTSPLFPVEENMVDTALLYPVEEIPTEIPPAVETESVESLDFQALRAVEISRLANQDELIPETPGLLQMLQETLPVPPESSPALTETTETNVEIADEPEQVTEVLTEELTLPTVPEERSEVVEELGDVATRIETYRSRLGTFPTDEKATLALADTCLRYGMLEDALQHYQRLQIANPSCLETSARIIKAALWMEDIPTVKGELWKAANLSFDVGDLKTCQDRLGDLLSLEREHKDARQLMVDVFLAGGQEKLAAWHLSQMVERAVAEKEYNSAILSLKRLYEISPSDAALERLGELYQKQNQKGEALEIFRKLRTTHLDKQEYADAVRLGRLVLELDPERTDDREVLIDVLLREGRQSEVLQQRLDLADLYRKQGHIDNAIELLQGVLTEEPDHLDAERFLVELHLQNRSIELAEQHAESLAERFLEQKAYEKAINLFEYWVGAAPSSPRTRERLAQFYQLHGDLNAAKMEWLVVTESHQAAGDFQRAARSLERALELEPQQNEWRLRLAQLKAQELNQVESALQDFRVLFQADPTWRKATVSFLELLMEQSRMSELGEVLQVLERFSPDSELKDAVVTKVKKKMSDEPDNLVLAFGWGELCLALGMLDLAIEQFQRLRRHEEYQLHSYRLLGLCFSRKKGFNMVELALSQFRRGLALDVGSASDRLELRYDLAAVLREHGRGEEALEQLQQVALEDPNYRDVASLICELS